MTAAREQAGMTSFPLVYIAGPYRGDVATNTARALKVARQVFQLGAFAITPHVLSQTNEDAQPEPFWLEGTREVMLLCDAVVVVPGWVGSWGTDLEIKIARIHRMSVFFFQQDAHAFRDWLKKQPGRRTPGQREKGEGEASDDQGQDDR